MNLIAIVFLLSIYRQNCLSHFYDIPIVDSFVYGENNSQIFDESTGFKYDPLSPLVQCSYLPHHSFWCEPPLGMNICCFYWYLDLRGNKSRFDELKYGCLKWGGRSANEVMLTQIVCHALDDIECFGNRTFFINDYPCLHFKGHYFVTTFIYSFLLGFLGVDRLCLGHMGTGIGKLLTLGGAGVWWLVDIVLIIRGELRPADDSSWMPFY